MTARWHIPVLMIALTTVLAGCGKPYRTEVRDEAKERMAIVRAQVYFDQAKQAFSTGQFDRAMREIDLALSIYEESPGYHITRGRILLETHRLEAAMKAFERAIELDEENADANYFAGIVLQRWSNQAGAMEHYLRAFELKSDNAQYLLAAAESMIAQRQFASAKRLIESKLSYFEHNATFRQLLGEIALLQNDPKTAAGLFADARLLRPDDVDLAEELARAQFAAGMYAQCHYTIRQLQQQSTEKNPEWIQYEARCLTMMDRSNEARNVYLQLVKLTPADAGAWIELGNLAYEVGDYRRVAMCSVRVIALAPDRFEGYALKGLYERYKGNTETALELFQQAAELAPDVAWPHLLLGMTLEDDGKQTAALSAYGRALQAESDNAEAQLLFNRAAASSTAVTQESTDQGR